jgi:membrane-associated phospholipid phosphatase
MKVLSAHLVLVALALLFFAPIVHAQPPPPDLRPPVQPWADGVSWATAFANPTVAAIEAWRSPRRGCKFAQLAIAEAVGNVAVLTLKHFIISPRPGFGLPPDGDPSGHSTNSMIGFSARNWGLGLSFGFATGALRYDAHRHFPGQIAKGLILGALAEGAGHLLRCPE